MEFKALDANGPVVLIPEIHGDSRGFFMETFRQNEFDAHCGQHVFVQDNQSKSTKNVLRGLHYQLRRPQGKLVRVILGRVFDVAVDLRKASPHFGKSYGVFLDAEKYHGLWVPPGFAHGFLVISDEAEFAYKCTTYYDPADEHCLRWDDASLAINWPLEGASPILSAKDLKGLPLAETPVYE